MLKNKIVKTLISLSFGTGQEFLFQILSVLLWIKFWGSEYYSEWLLISLFPTLLIRGNTGLFHGATSELIIAVQSNTWDKAKNCLSGLKRATNIFIFAMGLFWFATIFIFLWSGQFKVISNVEVICIGALYYIQFILFQRLQTNLCILKAVNEIPRSINWQNTYRVIGILALLLPCVWFTGPICLALAVAGQAIVTIAASFEIAGKREQFSGGILDNKLALRLLRNGIEFSIFPFSQSMLHTLTVWLVGIFLGNIQAASFHNMRTLARSSVLISRIFEQTARYEISKAVANALPDKVQMISKRLLAGNLLAAFSALIFLAIFGETIFQTLTQSKLEFNSVVHFLLCVGSAIAAVSMSFLAPLFAINHQGRMAGIYLFLTAVFCIVFAIACSFGVVELAIAGIAFEVIVLVISYLESTKTFNSIGAVSG